jgi:hypothetical protein
MRTIVTPKIIMSSARYFHTRFIAKPTILPRILWTLIRIASQIAASTISMEPSARLHSSRGVQIKRATTMNRKKTTAPMAGFPGSIVDFVDEKKVRGWPSPVLSCEKAHAKSLMQKLSDLTSACRSVR